MLKVGMLQYMYIVVNDDLLQYILPCMTFEDQIQITYLQKILPHNINGYLLVTVCKKHIELHVVSHRWDFSLPRDI